jgi:hypothetical protein
MKKPSADPGERVRVPSGRHKGRIGTALRTHTSGGPGEPYYFALVMLDDGGEAGVFDARALEIVAEDSDDPEPPVAA